jgi:hypothetical protein
VTFEGGRSVFAVEAGVEQMVAKRKENSDIEGRDHQSWGRPVNPRHLCGELRFGRSCFMVAEYSV